MSKATKLIWLPLTILLALLLIAGTAIYLDRKTALEYAISTFTDYRLAINGPFYFDVSGDELTLRLTNVVLRSHHHEEPLLTANLLGLKAEVTGMSTTSIRVRELILRGAKATVIRNEDGTTNWPVSPPEEDAPPIDWDSLLNTVKVKNTQLSLTGFTEQPLQLNLKTLELLDVGDERKITLDANLNDHPLNLSARLENLSGFLLQGEPFRLSANGRIENLHIKADGTFGDGIAQTDLRVSAEGENLSHLTSLISKDIPTLGQLSASARLLEAQGNYQLQGLQLFLDSPAFKLNANGDASHTDDGLAMEIKLSFSSDDISKLSNRQELAQWQGLKVNLDTAVNYKPGQGQLTDLQLTAYDTTQTLELASTAIHIHHEENRITAVQTLLSDLAYRYKNTDTGAKPLLYEARANTVKAIIETNGDVKLTGQGNFKTLPFKLDGTWQHTGDYGFDVELDKAIAYVEGFFRDSVFKIGGQLTTPSLKPLAVLVEEDEVPIDRGDLEISFLIKDEIAELSHLDLKLTKGDSAITVKGGIRNLYNQQGMRFDVTAISRQLNALNQWIDSSADAVDRTLAALAQPESFATHDKGYKNTLPTGHAWLAPIIDELDIERSTEEYPMLNGKTDITLNVNGAGDIYKVHISKVKLQSDMANIRWTGHINSREDSFELTGQLNAELKKSAIEELATDASINAVTSGTKDGPLTLSKLHVIAGKTELNGTLELTLEQKLKAVTGNIDFKRLDIFPYTPPPVIIERDQGEIENNNKKSEEETSEPLFSTEDYPLDWLPTYDVNVKLSAAEMLTPWFTANTVNTTLINKDKIFSLQSADLLIQDAHVKGDFHLDHSISAPKVSLFIRSDNFDPDLVTLVRNYDIVQKGHASVLIDLKGQGKNEQQLAASLNGKMTLVTREAILNGNDVNALAPTVIKEINQKVNPFYDKDKVENTNLDCGIIHFDIKDGIMEADKSIILVTPEIVFGAHGAIDLKEDFLRMQIIPQTRKGLGLSISGTFAKMAIIDGPIQNPTVGFNKTGAAITGTRDVTGTVLLGPLYWIYLGQAQKFLASGKACEKVITKVAPEFAKVDEEEE